MAAEATAAAVARLSARAEAQPFVEWEAKTVHGLAVGVRAGPSAVRVDGQLLCFGGLNGCVAGAAATAGSRGLTRANRRRHGRDAGRSRQVAVMPLDGAHEWAEVKCKGPTPAARSGHAVCASDDTVFVFGGATLRQSSRPLCAPLTPTQAKEWTTTLAA